MKYLLILSALMSFNALSAPISVEIYKNLLDADLIAQMESGETNILDIIVLNNSDLENSSNDVQLSTQSFAIQYDNLNRDNNTSCTTTFSMQQEKIVYNKMC